MDTGIHLQESYFCPENKRLVNLFSPQLLKAFSSLGESKLEPVLQEQEVFLCCTVQRNRLASGGPISPLATTPGAQWFIVSRKRCFDILNVIIKNKCCFHF